MKITYFGHSFLLLQGEDYSICLDPFGDIGLKIPNVVADYVFLSHNHYDHNNLSAVNYKKIVTNGENFEIIPTFHDDEKGKLRGNNNVLLFGLDGYKIAFLGDYGESENPALIEKLVGVDILFLPIGGKYTINYKTAFKYQSQIQPKTVIPIHYKIAGSNIDIDGLQNYSSLVKDYKVKNSPYIYDCCDKIVVLTVKKEL